MAATILDPSGRPVPPAALRRLGEPVAGPTLAGVRPVFAGHPAEGLTPARLAAIHRAAAQGDALAYLELAEDIEERDLHYAAVLGTRKRALCQLPVTVEAASEDPEHVRHADFLREWLKTGVLGAALFDLLDAIGKGFSVLEIEWRTEPGMIVPARLIYRPQRWFGVPLEDGETIMLREGVGLAPLAPHKFVVHKHPAKSGLPMRSGLARLVSWAWMYKSFTLRDWAIFCQNYGAPLRLGRYGPEASEEDRRVLWRAVANIAGDCAAIIPKGMEIEFVEAAGLKEGAELYLKRADWLNREISKAVLGQTTTTEAISGGHAVAQEHRLVQEDIERADAAMVAVTLTRQVAHPIIAFNFGPQAAYPQIRIGRPDEVPLREQVEALHKLVPLGLTVEAAEVRDRLGLSEPAPEAEVLGGRAAPAPGGGPPPAPAPALQTTLRGLLARHLREPEPDLVEALTERLAEDAQGALAGLAAPIRRAFEEATDMQDLARRLSLLQLDPRALAEAMGRGLALAHLVGQAALLDELRRG
ncbi:hypothetical protein GCM10010964_18560 [Caldovatus sediminis]|uniref:DUF935 domain-containing protein n=1 Tax=Caldovatus sediminis TaxID=2041189 RepID=A0A8J2ZAJ3_9PROT|nr:DUF935 domain-containing protein [Caldovatus sediminis]GGG30911.1 hypothetical protein GCM10010964_18560 [Caldovatus sediminis]